MAGRITFNVGDVRTLIDHARGSLEHSASYEDLFNPAFHKGGKLKKDANGWPDHANLDISKIKPALHLVKDDGIYLMSNGSPRLVLADNANRSFVAYAAEGNPNTLEFEDWYDAARAIMGGDDCVVSLPLSMFDAAVKGKKATDSFRLRVTKRAISLVV